MPNKLELEVLSGAVSSAKSSRKALPKWLVPQSLPKRLVPEGCVIHSVSLIHFSQFLVVDHPGRVAPLVADNRVGVALSGGMIAESC